MPSVKSCVPLNQHDVFRALDAEKVASERVELADRLVARAEYAAEEFAAGRARPARTSEPHGGFDRRLVRPSLEMLNEAREQVSRRARETSEAQTQLLEAHVNAEQGVAPAACKVSPSTANELRVNPDAVDGVELPARPTEPMTYYFIPIVTYPVR